MTKRNQTEPLKSASDLNSQLRLPKLVKPLAHWIGRQPVLAILLVSLLAVAINCYPIIFCGRSYVSPASVGAGGALVYGRWPPLPNMMNSITPAQTHGRDTWAAMLWGVPAGFIESRSLLEQGEIPLWNRYGHAGDTFIGQSGSMLGDPLQGIVILGHGSAGAWDVKFLAAKFIFCAGFGMLILRLIGSRPLSLLYAVIAAYSGAYFCIGNHPVFFVFSYAPWILLSALGLLDLQSRRPALWGLVWLLVNLACFNAGHVEVAVDLIGGLNFAALVGGLAACRNATDRVRLLGRIALGTLLFLGLTAPVSMSFLGALGGSHSVHVKIQVEQLPLKCLPGVFDDLFDFLLTGTAAFNPRIPETGVLVLVGFMLAAWQWRQLKSERFFWINSAAILLWSACIFGVIPAFVFAAIPLLNRVGHIYADFSYLLVIHLTIQSAYGFRCLTKIKDFRRSIIVLACMALILESAIGIEYWVRFGYWCMAWNFLLCAVAGAFGAPLLFIHFKNRDYPITVTRWLAIAIVGFIPQYRFALYHRSLGNDDPLMIPGPRVVLNAPSQAVDIIQADRSGPFRVVGLDQIFFGDYSAVYGLEDIRSCAPLSNAEFIDLFRTFPGILFDGGWLIKVVDPSLAQPLLNLLNVKYVLAPPDIADRHPGFRVTDRSDFEVMENSQVWPRAYFADQVLAIESNEAFIQQLLTNGVRPFIALTEAEMAKQPGLEPLAATGPPIVVAATHYVLLPNSTAFDIHAPTAGMVCLTEGQAKDFTATANGEAREVLTVNRAFKGVYLDKGGDYHITFTYRPRHWHLACTCFWSALAAAAAIALGASLISKALER